jgi:Nif-specific regulatory protein
MADALTSRRLDQLIDISRALMSDSHVERVVSRILEAGIEMFDCEGCSLALVDDDQTELRFVAMEGEAKTAPFRIPVASGIAGDVVSSGQPVIVNDVASDQRFLKAVDQSTGYQTRSLMCVPVKKADKVIGVMQALNQRGGRGFETADAELLSALGGLACAALNRARDEEQLRNADHVWREYADVRYHMVPSRNAGMKEVLRIARTAAKTDATVLLLGESGTGKEVLARTVHRYSRRDDGPFIAINCTALTPSLLESELFGHEKGSFTGATHTKKGKFELANGGTLFLDEIGDLAPELQTKLLRVLQEREFERVGGSETFQVDVRVIAATNRDLRSAMENKEFREDLFYRLNVITLLIPPLRERPEDIAALCTHFLMRSAQNVKRSPMRLSDDALSTVLGYRWPGNVREVANVMERAVVLTEGCIITSADLPTELTGVSQPGTSRRATGNQRLTDLVRGFKRQLIREALDAAEGNQSRAAKQLGVQQPNLSRMMKSLGLR